MSRSSHSKSNNYIVKIIAVVSLIIIGIMAYIIYNKKECPECKKIN